jgi:hypothetical protein
MDGYAQVSLVLVCLVLLASLVSGLILSHIALKPVRLIQETACLVGNRRHRLLVHFAGTGRQEVEQELNANELRLSLGRG